MLRFIGQAFDPEFHIKVTVATLCLLLGAVAIYLYDTTKRDWQIEAEGIVKRNLPIGTSRVRVAKWLASSKHSTRNSTRDTVHIYLWSSTMQHRPSNLYDSVVVDVYFDSSQKVAAYGYAHPERVTWP